MLVTTSPFVKMYTLDEFWQLPDPLDRSKLELIRGVLYVTPPPDEHVHDPVVSRLIRLFSDYLVRANWPGQLYVPRSGIWTYYPDTWLEPDLFYLSSQSVERFRDRPRSSADLVVEVLSPESALYDRTTKADTYAALGVVELWLVDPTKRTVEVRYGRDRQWTETQALQAGEQVRSRVLTGLVLSVADVFADLPATNPPR